MRIPWKLIGLAGLAGVAATGVLVARPSPPAELYARRAAPTPPPTPRCGVRQRSERTDVDQAVTPHQAGLAVAGELSRFRRSLPPDGHLERLSVALLHPYRRDAF